MRNPFVADRPLTQDDLYYGRDDALDLLRHGLVQGESLFYLQGPTGLGKTSFLNQLPLRMTRCDVRIVSWADVQPNAGAGTTVNSCLVNLVAECDGDSVVLCVDDIPHEMANTSWQDLAPEGCALVLAFEGSPGETVAIPGAVELPLHRLVERDVQDLLMIPSRRRLAWGLDVAQRIFRLSGGDPFLCQMYGHHIFERRAGSGWVSMPDVDDATEVIAERQHLRFDDLWQAASPAGRLVFCCLAEMPGRRDLAQAEDVDTYLRQQRIEVAPELAAEGLADLLRLGVISRLGGETYRITAEVIRHWLRAHHSVAEVVQEHRVFRQHHAQPTPFLQSERIDWVGMALWVIAVALLIGIGYVWRSRQTTILVSSTPTPRATGQAASVPSTELPTPEKGMAPGQIAYQAKEPTDHHWSIYAMRSDGSDPVRLTNSGANDTSPVWSPDGRRIAFVSDRDGNREIYTMNADGNDQRNLTVNGAEDWTPTWSPDGSEIAFASYRDGNWDLYVIAADGATDGAEPTRLTDDPGSDYGPAWSPDGELLAFCSNRDGDLNIYVMSLVDGETWQVTEDTSTDQTPAWRPDGAALIWESYRENNMELYVGGVDGADMAPLSRDAYADDHGACWSPWGGSVVFYSNRDEGWDIYTYHVETGERLNLTMSSMLEQAPNWGP